MPSTPQRRMDQRNKILRSPEFKKVVNLFCRYFDTIQIQFALIGGIAVAVYANPPLTPDVDFLVDLRRDDPRIRFLQAHVREFGWRSQTDEIPPKIVGSPHLFTRFSHPAVWFDVDCLYTDGDSHLIRYVRHAKVRSAISNIRIPVIRPEDLILLKVVAGREKDLADEMLLREVLAETLDQGYLRRGEELLRYGEDIEEDKS